MLDRRAAAAAAVAAAAQSVSPSLQSDRAASHQHPPCVRGAITVCDSEPTVDPELAATVLHSWTRGHLLQRLLPNGGPGILTGIDFHRANEKGGDAAQRPHKTLPLSVDNQLASGSSPSK